MNALFFKLRKLRFNTRLHFTVKLIGISDIYLGQNCKIDPYCFLKREGPNGKLQIGNDVTIKRYSHISAKGLTIEIKENSYIGYNNWIGGRGNINIDQNFISGMNVVIISSNHDYYNINVPYHKGEEIKGDITIGKNVWIGANSVVLPGVSIGDNSVVSAGSIVAHNFPANVLIAGNPAKEIKNIKRKQ